MRLRRIALAVGLVALLAATTAPRPTPRGADAVPGEALAITARQAFVAAPETGPVRLLSALSLSSEHPRFGGLSAVEVSGDGRQVLFLSDRGMLFTARLRREDGRLVGIESAEAHRLRAPGGGVWPENRMDGEGLATGPDGAIYVSFEGEHRIWRYAAPGARAQIVPPDPAFARLQRNSGLEALAATADGTLYTIPERSGALERPFPVWRLAPGARHWEEGRLPRMPPHLVTGADIGPDGRLYVLERDFTLLGGWGMRLRRADLATWPDLETETLLELRRGGVDNMEGISLWRDPDGRMRAVLVSDDNFHPLQRTLLLEFAVD